MNTVVWNPWHGCSKVSTGCLNCYVDRLDRRYGRVPEQFFVTQQLDLPIHVNQHGSYKYPAGTMFLTCFTSDFLLDKADDIRQRAWENIAERDDCKFMFVTKRIERFMECLPAEWKGRVPDNLIVCVTCENQEQADKRLPIFLDLPIKHKRIVVEPMLEEVALRPYLQTGQIESICAGGESGSGVRELNLLWIKALLYQCKDLDIPFWFKQTGARFIDEHGHLVSVARSMQYDYADEHYLSTCNWMYDDDLQNSNWRKFIDDFNTHVVWHYPLKHGKIEPWMNFVVRPDGKAVFFVWDTRQYLFMVDFAKLPDGYQRTPDNYHPIKGYQPRFQKTIEIFE